MPDERLLVRSPAQRLAVIVIGAIALWVSLAITVVNITATSSPEVALKIWPWSSAAHSALANRQIKVGRVLTPREATGVAALARAASARSVVDVPAARAYGMAMLFQQHLEQGRASLAFSQFLSRRDLPTQLALIEEAVERNDVGGALIHYDRALRVSLSIRDTLFPILVAAAEQQPVRAALARTLSRRPPWWAAFISQEIGKATTPEALMPLIAALHLDMRDPSHAQMMGAAMDRLVTWGRLDDAWRLDRSYWPSHRGDPVVANGDFEQSAGVGPFRWTLTNTGDLAASIETHDVGHALYLSSQSQSGVVARQIARLTPGPSVLSVRSGGFGQGERATLTLTCVGIGEPLFVEQVASADQQGQVTDRAFTVPDNCRYGLLAIGYEAGQEDGDAWLDDISIRRTSR